MKSCTKIELHALDSERMSDVIAMRSSIIYASSTSRIALVKVLLFIECIVCIVCNVFGFIDLFLMFALLIAVLFIVKIIFIKTKRISFDVAGLVQFSEGDKSFGFPSAWIDNVSYEIRSGGNANARFSKDILVITIMNERVREESLRLISNSITFAKFNQDDGTLLVQWSDFYESVDSICAGFRALQSMNMQKIS